VSRKRVHQVAKEFSISSEALIEMLKDMKVPVKSHMSTIEDSVVDEIRRRFETEKASVREEYARKEKELARRREQQKPAEKTVESKKRMKRKRPTGKQRKENEQAVRDSVRKVMALMDGGAKGKKRKKKHKLADGETAEESGTTTSVQVPNEPTTVSTFAQLMDCPPAEIIKMCMKLGMMVTINQPLDTDTMEAIADEMGIEIEVEDKSADTQEVTEGPAEPRNPVVTVMGHVDHGKTSLLDYIRRANVVSDEDGGITQHIGAYEVVTPEGRITFIDTPGHEAFTTMRTRGAQVTDIVVLVVAAEEGVKPQTIEAINHARAGNTPIIVAINKIDLPDANLDVVRQQLASYNVMVEEWGGDVLEAPVSARTGEGIDRLLELILLQAEVMELTAPKDGPAHGVVLEARLDPGFGPVATVLVRQGTLRTGDSFVVGSHSGRARVLMDENGDKVDEAIPSRAVQVAGISGVPSAGDTFQVMSSERAVRDIAERRSEKRRIKDLGTAPKATLEDLFKRIREGEAKELKIVLKADVQGSIEAIVDSISRLGSQEVHVEFVHQAIGGITESDVLLASASEAIIVGFQVRPSSKAQEIAEREGVDIRHYRVIYECVEDIQKALEGLLEPEIREKALGRASVRAIFRHPRAGMIAGCFVLNGTVLRGARCRVLRDGVVMADSRVGSLRRFKEDVREVQSGYECGISVENFTDVHEGDVLEIYTTEEIERSLN